MKTLAFALFVALLAACGKGTQPSTPDAQVDAGHATEAKHDAACTPAGATWEVNFSPKGGCSESIVKHLDGAKKTIRMQAYGFTSKPIAEALVRARLRNVDVQIIFDRSDKTTPSPTTKVSVVLAGGVTAFYDLKHVIAHNKVIIIDGLEVETGSYNFTENAETGNAENCIWLTDAALAAKYNENWEAHKAHAEAAR